MLQTTAKRDRAFRWLKPAAEGEVPIVLRTNIPAQICRSLCAEHNWRLAFSSRLQPIAVAQLCILAIPEYLCCTARAIVESFTWVLDFVLPLRSFHMASGAPEELHKVRPALSERELLRGGHEIYVLRIRRQTQRRLAAAVIRPIEYRCRRADQLQPQLPRRT
jgi:hypothetical protein